MAIRGPSTACGPNNCRSFGSSTEPVRHTKEVIDMMKKTTDLRDATVSFYRR
jgi:hypothetical protein